MPHKIAFHTNIYGSMTYRVLLAFTVLVKVSEGGNNIISYPDQESGKIQTSYPTADLKHFCKHSTSFG